MLPIFALGQAITVKVNGETVDFPGVGPQEMNGHVLVPLRGVMEYLGAYVSYDAATKTVTANKSGIDLVLRLGERSALVNGRTVALDVPAQEYRGSTMVPLRFVGESLGAEVRWDAPTYTVNITVSTGGAQGDPNQFDPPRQAPPNEITLTSFASDRSGFLRGGDEVRFTMRGAPGGRATFSIPGVVEDVPMTEDQAGVYVGSFRVPTDSRLNLSKASAVGRLRMGNRERIIQASNTIGIFNQAPVITLLTPESNTRVGRAQPNISATFDVDSGSGIDPNSVEMRVDDRNVTRDAQVTSNMITYRPDRPLAGGRHNVTVRATDRAGNLVTKSWSFEVMTDRDVIKSLRFDTGGQPLAPGTDITVTLVGEAGGKATYSVGDRVVDRRMRETEPGHYVGTYTIRRNDIFDNIVVTGKLVTTSGDTFTAEATDRMTISGPLEAPTFTSPEEGSRVESPVTFRGKAAPGSRVQIKIEYSKNPLGVVRLRGTVAELTVTADDRGNWTTDPIDMRTGFGGGNATFTVTAATRGANGKTSETRVLTVHQ